MQIMQQKAKTVPDGATCSPLRQGWNKKWDEWVEAPGLVKYDAKLVRSEDDRNGEGEGGPNKKRRTDGRAGGVAGSDAVGPVAEARDNKILSPEVCIDCVTTRRGETVQDRRCSGWRGVAGLGLC